MGMRTHLELSGSVDFLNDGLLGLNVERCERWLQDS